MGIKTINEKSRYKRGFIFENEDLERFTPTTVRYRVDDRDSGNEVIGWTPLTPADSISITIPSDSNRILNNCNVYETRILTVQSDFDTDDQLSIEVEYRIRNLRGFN